MSTISFDDFGAVKIGDTLLPGIYQSMEISGKLRFDESKIQNQSGNSKQPLGFEDAVISLSLILPTNSQATCYDRLSVIVALFYNINKQGKPYVYKLVNNLTHTWGIRDVLFSDLKVKDDNQKKDSIAVDIVFLEYRPVVVKREQKSIPANYLDPYTDFAQLKEIAQIKSGLESPAKDDDVP